MRFTKKTFLVSLHCFSFSVFAAAPEWTPATQIPNVPLCSTYGNCQFSNVTSCYDEGTGALMVGWDFFAYWSTPNSFPCLCDLGGRHMNFPFIAISNDQGSTWETPLPPNTNGLLPPYPQCPHFSTCPNPPPCPSPPSPPVGVIASESYYVNDNGFPNLFMAYDKTHSTLAAAWIGPYNSCNSYREVVIATSTNGGASWTPTKLTGTNASASNDVSLSYISNETFLASWADNVPTIAISSDGGITWGSPITIPQTGNPVYGDVLTCETTPGSVVAAWSNQQFFAINYSPDSGQRWQTQVQIADTAIPGALLCPVYDSLHGTTIVTFSNTPSIPPMLPYTPSYAISINDGGVTWEAAQPIDPTGTAQCTSNVFACYDPSSGALVAAWADENYLPTYSLSSDGGHTWSVPAKIDAAQPVSNSGSGLPSQDIYVSYDAGNKAVVATWQNAADFTPYYSFLSFGGILPPKKNLKFLGSGNAAREAVYLNLLAGEPSIDMIIKNLIPLSQEQIEEALLRMLPKALPRVSAANTLFIMSQTMENRCSEKTFLRTLKQQRGTLTAHLYEGFNNLLADASDGLPYGSVQKAAQGKENYAFWVDGFGEFATQRSQDQMPEFGTTTAGAMTGFDYYGFANGQISTAFTYAKSHVNAPFNRDQVDFYGLALYGIGHIYDGYIELGTWGIFNQYEQDRHILFPGFNAHATSAYNGGQVAPHLGFGYDFLFKNVVFEPYAKLTCTFVFQEAFSEHGAAPLNSKQNSTITEMLQALGGIRIYGFWEGDWGLCSIRGSLSYIYKKGFGIGNIDNVSFVGSPPGFDVIAYDRAENLCSPGLELLIKGRKGLFGSINYDGLFASDYFSNAIQAKVGLFF